MRTAPLTSAVYGDQDNDTGLRINRAASTIVMAVAALFFLAPIGAACWFALRDEDGFSLRAVNAVLDAPELGSALLQTSWIAVGAAAVSVILLAPTVVCAHLFLERWMSVLDAVSLIPLALPPVVLVSGLNITRGWFNVDLFGNPAVLVFIYAVVAMPFTYRIIATAVAAADLDSLVDAARLLGARPIQVLLLVVVPLIRRPLGNVALIAAAFCFGEYAIASLLAFGTFPVWLTVLGQQASHAAVALSAITLVGPWIVLMAVSLLIRNWRIAPIPDDSAVPRPESADERAATEPSHLPNGNEPALSIRSFQ